MGSCVCKDKIEDRRGSHQVPYRGGPLSSRSSLQGATSPRHDTSTNSQVQIAVLETLHLIRTLVDP